MTSGDPCPRCHEEVSLIDPTEDVWSLDPADYEEDSEVWLCVACGWNEQATDDESMEEALANMEWVMDRIANLG